MKKLSFLLALLLPIIPSANAAIAPKPMVQLAQVDPAASNVISSTTQIAVIGNREKNGFIQFLNGQPIELTAGVESFVSAATTDVSGNFYVVGASSNPIVGTLPPISGVLNPDNVVSDPVSSNKSDAVNLIYWKLDATGALLETQSMLMPSAIIPSAIYVDANSITVAGTSFANPGNNGFVVTWNGKPSFLGKNATQIHAISKMPDGSVVAVGQSSEKLLNTNLKGKVDGFLAKSVNGKFTTVIRSSEVKSMRAWKSTTSNLLLGGYVNTAAAITKFNNSFQPTWTDRYPSTGSALTASIGKFNYGAFVSTAAIKVLPAWKKKNAILVLTFDSKGLIVGANYVNATQLNGFTANSTYGPIVLAAGFLYRT